MAETRKLEPLSDFWRQRQSDIPEEELANVLDGARGYIGFFGSDFSVDWGAQNLSSAVALDKKRIELDYRPLKDKTPPFDGRAIDIVMGEAIHECGHIKWSYPKEKIGQYYGSKQGYGAKVKSPYFTFSPEEKQEIKELETVANVVEDFFVENKISETYPTLGAYLREARKLDVQLELPHNLIYDLSTDKPSLDSIATMWAAIALIDKEIPKEASKTSKKLLNKLINYTLEAGKAIPKKRIKISYQIWSELNALERARQKENERQLEKLQKKIQEEQKQEQPPVPEQGQGEGEPEPKPEQEQEPPEGEGEKSDEQEEETTEDTPSSGNGDGDRKDSEAEGDKGTEEGEEEAPEEPEKDKQKPDTEETEEGTGEEPETEEETPESSEEDIEPESRRDTEEREEEEQTIQENPDEPYLDHEKLRDCYSINTNLKESMPQDLKDEVDFHLDRKPEDITMQVDQMLGGAGGKNIIMELAGSDKKLAHKMFLDTRRIAQKVSRLFMYDKKLRTRFRRGLYEGTVDVRRLHRAGAQDYKLFQRKEVLSTPSLAVGILVDASGSMGGARHYGDEGELTQALKTAMALKTALEFIEGVDLMVMAYNTVSSHADIYSYRISSAHTYLHRIYDRRTSEFRPNVKANGGTPSGYALSGMVSQIGKYLRGKDRLIIHVTDGAPSSHEDVAQAVDFCKEHKIDVMTLTLSRFHEEVIESYRGLCEHLDNIEKLPDAVAKLLKTRLEKRMMRIK